jgi:hypothetical protein
MIDESDYDLTDPEEDPLLEISLDEPLEADAEAPFDYDENAMNLVTEFKAHPVGQEWLKDLADIACRRFDSMYENSEEYRERFAEMYSIFAADIPDKEYPYENSAKAHVPILVSGVTRLASHTIAELFPDRQRWLSVNQVGPDDAQIAEALTLHENWQFQNQIPDFSRQIDRGSLLFYLAGDVTAHSFYDPASKMNRHEVLTCDEFFIPYVRVTTMPDYSDVPYKIKLLDKYDFELEQMKGDWDEEGVDSVLKREAPSYSDEPEGKLRIAIADAQGIQAPDDDADAPYQIYQYEAMASLPPRDGEEEGPQRPICAFIDPKTKTVLKAYLREQVDWRDQVRHDRQQQELDQHQQGVDEHQQRLGRVDELAAAGPHPPASQPGMELATLQAMTAKGPPPPPSWAQTDEEGQVQPPEPPRMVPIELFSHGVNIENLMGALGLSQGRQLAEHNKTADTLLSMFLDAGALANSWSLLVPDTLAIEPGSFEIAPGKINQIPGVSGPDLRQSIMELKPQPANDQLVRVVDMMVEYGQQAAAAPEVMSGEPGKSGETFRGISTRLQQATRQLSKSGQKFADWCTQIFRNNGYLNSKHLPEEQMVYVLDHLAGEMRNVPINRKMYERNYQVTISADMEFRSKDERVAEADELLALPKSLPPPIAQGPGMMAYWHAAAIKSLRARGAHDLVINLGPPPPPPQTPFGMPTPEEIAAQQAAAAAGQPPGGPPGAPPGPGGPPPPGRPPARRPGPPQPPMARPAA